MALELGHVPVHELVLEEPTALEDGRLSVDAAALRRHLQARVPDLGPVGVHAVRPGDATRIVCVKDALEARGSPRPGRVHALRDLAVVTCGQIVGFQEGIIDMIGPGAPHSPFSGLSLLVLELAPEGPVTPHQHEAILRQAGLEAAALLGELAATTEPARIERFERAPVAAPDLPRIAYVYMLLSQGLLHDTYVRGENAMRGVPCLADPTLVFETAIVSGNCVSACDKNTTWHHQNHALVRELFARHGRELDFAGMVLTNSPTRLADKESSAARAVELAASLDPAGVIVSKEGFGNPDADLMLLVRGLERAGIRTVSITDEFAGNDGGSQSLADAAPEADAVVSTGNANERIVLPPMARTLGPIASLPRLAGADATCVRPDGSIEVELQVLLGSCNELGAGRLRGREI